MVSQRLFEAKGVITIIVRFTTWQHRTIVYRARKNCPKYKIRLDLTKKAWEVISKLLKLLEEKNSMTMFLLMLTVDYVQKLVISFDLLKMKRSLWQYLVNWEDMGPVHNMMNKNLGDME